MGYRLLVFSMKVNIIHDNRRIEKYGHLLDELIQQGITNYRIWDIVLMPNVVESINASHKQIIKWAKDNKQKEVCIFEEDVMFSYPNGWQYFLKNKPENFDVYIAGSYLTDNRYNWEYPLVKVNSWVGSHCIIVAEKYYDTLLSLSNTDHIDTANEGLGDFYVCFPFPCLQRPGFSANNMAVVDYNAALPNEYIYKE